MVEQDDSCEVGNAFKRIYYCLASVDASGTNER